MKSTNPTTERAIADYSDHSDQDVEALIARAHAAFPGWRDSGFAPRSNCLHAVAAALRARRSNLARLMAEEMGKPIAAGEAEVDKCAGCCDYFAEHAQDALKPREVPSDARQSFVRFDPLGVIFAIMPWNFPLWQLFRFAAPTLMAGNVALLKHAENVPGCALAIQEIFDAARTPAGVFTSLMISRDGAEKVIRHPRVAAVTLTGSTRAGKAVAAAAGSVLKKCVLELGGSDPFIVLADADPIAAAHAAADARCINSGQSCIAAKRFIIPNSLADRFEKALIEKMLALKVGDPLARETQIGPLARLDLLENLHDQVQRSIAAGAKLATGGQRLPRPGFFYAPTVLLNVHPGMPAFDEETFGPVAAVTRYNDIDEAIALANQSEYGLGASVWTSNPDSAAALASRIEAGCVFFNGAVKSDPRLPFGGIKSSGYGRELDTFGIHEFTNIKTVWIGNSKEPQMNAD